MKKRRPRRIKEPYQTAEKPEDHETEPRGRSRGALPYVFPDYSADEFEGAEGVEAQTAVFPQNDGLFVFDGFCDGLGVPFFLNAAGVEEEDLLSGREVSLRELQDVLVEFGVIDAGGETDQVISRKVGGVGFDCVDEGDVEAPGNGVQYFFVLPWWAE